MKVYLSDPDKRPELQPSYLSSAAGIYDHFDVYIQFQVNFRILLCRSAQSAARYGTAVFVEDVSEHGVGNIGYADLHRRPVDAGRSNEKLHFVLFPDEGMLDGRHEL